jgi:hypothetical protein
LAILTWFVASLIMPKRDSVRECAAERAAAVRLVPLVCICAALCALLGLGIAVQLHAAALFPFAPQAGAVPIVMLDDTGAGDAPTSNAELCISVAESACLFALYRTLRRCRPTRAALAILGAAFAVLVAVAVASPVANSSDLYGYVGFALQSGTAYAPVALPFTGDHAPINAMFGLPRPAAWYGPLWIGTTHVLLLPFAALATQLHVLRLLEVAALIACLVTLARLGTRLEVLALLAINPALFGVWIVDGHNDLFGIAFVVVAVACRRFPVMRAILVAAAGLVKLPLVLIGAAAFLDERSVLRRIAFAGAAVAACLALSYAFGGTHYLVHLFSVSGRRHDGAEGYLHAASACAAVAALAAALLGRRLTLGATWLWRALGAFPAPWYAIWGLPYALASGGAALFLIAEPIDSYLFSWNYAATGPEYVLKFAVLIGPVSYAILRRIAVTKSSGPGAGVRRAPGEIPNAA